MTVSDKVSSKKWDVIQTQNRCKIRSARPPWMILEQDPKSSRRVVFIYPVFSLRRLYLFDILFLWTTCVAPSHDHHTSELGRLHRHYLNLVLSYEYPLSPCWRSRRRLVSTTQALYATYATPESTSQC